MISKGITLSYATDGGSYEELKNLQEIPELGGDRESVEITCLEDMARRYEDGIYNYGDSITFKFLYEKEQFNLLNSMDDVVDWRVTLPDNTSCTFGGKGSVKLDGVGVNAALTYTLAIKPNSEMVWA